jgi:hypothetical protein
MIERNDFEAAENRIQELLGDDNSRTMRNAARYREF